MVGKPGRKKKEGNKEKRKERRKGEEERGWREEERRVKEKGEGEERGTMAKFRPRLKIAHNPASQHILQAKPGVCLE